MLLSSANWSRTIATASSTLAACFWATAHWTEFSAVLKKYEEEVYLPYDGTLSISPLGVSINGRVTEEVPPDESISFYHVRLYAWTADGREIPLELSGSGGFLPDGSFQRTYRSYSEETGWTFLNMREVAYVTIGETATRIDFNWE